MKFLTKKIIKNSLFFISLVLIVLLCTQAYSRPGGGHSYSSGSSDGGSGSGDGAFELIIWILMELPPEISIPLVCIIITFYLINKYKKKPKTVVSSPTLQNRIAGISKIESSINFLKNRDSNFSRILFLDFVSSIYYKLYNTLDTKEFVNLKPFLSEHEKINLQKSINPNRQFTEIVIGSISIYDIFEHNSTDNIVCDIDANYTINLNQHSTRYIVSERWHFSRKTGLLSHEPQKMRDIHCPNCGAPANFSESGKCQYCETQIIAGQMQWQLFKRSILSQEVFQAKGLGHYSQEVGTEIPSIIHPKLNKHISNFVEEHKVQDWQLFLSNFGKNIVVKFFTEIYTAWSKNQWEKVRHLLSDKLFESYNFWIKQYKIQQLRNRLEKIIIQKVDLVKIETDKFYEAFTIRIYANCLDYVETTEGKLIGGSKNKARFFSEYWTFVRKRGLEKNLNEISLNNCPNCGAPADKMGQAAICGYCGAKISTGDFSWVLSLITQDEIYTG